MTTKKKAAKKGDSLGVLIRRTRCNAEMSLREASRRCDISAPFLSDVERDKRTPNRKMLCRIWLQISGRNHVLEEWETIRIEQLVSAYRRKVEEL